MDPKWHVSTESLLRHIAAILSNRSAFLFQWDSQIDATQSLLCGSETTWIASIATYVQAPGKIRLHLPGSFPSGQLTVDSGMAGMRCPQDQAWKERHGFQQTFLCEMH